MIVPLQMAAQRAHPYRQLIPVTAIRVAIRIAITGIGPVRIQSTLAAVSIKAPTKATALETTVAETGVTHLHGPTARCTAAAETAVARCNPEASETAVAHRDPEVSETAAARRDPEASETAAAAKAVTSAAQINADASTAETTATAAPCERDCAGRRGRYAEHDSRSCCNHLLAHCSNSGCFIQYGEPQHDRCARVAAIGSQLHQSRRASKSGWSSAPSELLSR
jgi:hypothetical protein